MLKDLVRFLTKREILTVALGLIISNSVLEVTGSFADDLVLPAIDPLLKKLGGEKLSELKLKVMGAELKVGKFLQTLIRFVVLGFVVMMLTKFLKK